MNKKIGLLGVLNGLCFVFILNSCGSGNESEKKEEMKDTIVAVDTTKKIVAESDVSYVLPSPMQIAGIFKKSGLKYFSGITNSTENINKYTSGNNMVKAINLGVYSADLSYCILNKQNQDTKNYFKTCKQLASDIGLSKAFETNNVVQRMEKNITNEDSISRLLSEIQMQTDNILEESNQDYVSVISFTGAWIESMYIGIEVLGKENGKKISVKLVEQMPIAENIVKALKANATKETGMAVLINEMNSLNDIYNNFKLIKELKATDPEIIDPEKVNITQEELQTFSKKIEEIRSRFVKG